jgi:hypothetical protein
LAWQWQHYPGNHADRRNLVIHLITVPIFWGGTVAMLGAPLAGGLTAMASSFAAGLVMCVVAMAAQGRGHKLETVPPIPFRGPVDVIARIFVEQWLTFPRFVLSGQIARAWSAGRPT